MRGRGLSRGSWGRGGTPAQPSRVLRPLRATAVQRRSRGQWARRTRQRVRGRDTFLRLSQTCTWTSGRVCNQEERSTTMGFVGTDLLGKTHESARDRPLLRPWPTNFSQGKHLRQHPVRTTRDIPQLCLAGEPAVTTRELGIEDQSKSSCPQPRARWLPHAPAGDSPGPSLSRAREFTGTALFQQWDPGHSFDNFHLHLVFKHPSRSTESSHSNYSTLCFRSAM